MKNFNLSLVCLFISVLTHGQFLQNVPSAYSNLTTAQLERIDTINARLDGNIVNSALLLVNPLAANNVDGLISINSNLSDCGGLNLRVTYLDYQDSENYLLLAEAIDENNINECLSANLLFYCDTAVYYGELSSNESNFQLLDIGGNLIYMVELLPFVDSCSSSHPEVNPIDEPNLLANLESFNQNTEECDQCDISVLFCFTRSARSGHRAKTGTSLIALISAYIVEFNNAAHRSRGAGETAPPKLKLAGTYLIPNFNEHSYTNSKLLLRDLTFYRPDINLKRVAVKADVVSTFIYSRAFRMATSVAGEGYLGLNDPLTDKSVGAPAVKYAAYNFINLEYLPFGAISYVHEVGHNLGAGHQDIKTLVSNRATEISYKDTLWVRRKYEQSVVYKGALNRVKYFSNPNIYRHSKPFGVQNTDHNYTYITQNRCTVGNYFADPKGQYKILGEAYACPDLPVILNLCRDLSLYNGGITWYTSLDAINWTPIGNGASMQVYALPQVNSILHIKVEMISYIPGTTTPIIFTDYHTLQTASAVYGYPCTLKNASEAINEIQIQVTPNPFNDYVLISNTEAKSLGNLKYSIINSSGKKLEQQELFAYGTSQVMVQTNNLIAGTYILEVYLHDRTFRFKIIKP